MDTLGATLGDALGDALEHTWEGAAAEAGAMYRGLARHLPGQEGVDGAGTEEVEEMEVVVLEVAMVVETVEDAVVGWVAVRSVISSPSRLPPRAAFVPR